MPIESLDLTYIHPRVIVIGSPYPNNALAKLRNYFTQNLIQNNNVRYCIYNFSSEEEYNIEQDLENVITYGFPENSPCPFEYLIHICTLIDVYLNRHPDNIVVLHSKSGKGRSCLVAGCLLLLLAHVKSATEAVQVIREKRGSDALTLPSQIRYLYYYERLLRRDEIYTNTFQLLAIRVNTIPKFNSSIVQAGCTPFFTVEVLATDQTHHYPTFLLHNHSEQPIQDPLAYQRQYVNKKIFESFNPTQSITLNTTTGNNALNNKNANGLLKYRTNYDEMIEYDLTNHPIFLRGDICLSFYHYSNNNQKHEKMFQIFIHSGFIEKPLSIQLAAAINSSSASVSSPNATALASSLQHNLYYQSFQKVHVDYASNDVYNDIFDEKFSIELLFQQKDNNFAINQFTDEEYISMVDSAYSLNITTSSPTIMKKSQQPPRSKFTTTSARAFTPNNPNTPNFFSSQFN